MTNSSFLATEAAAQLIGDNELQSRNGGGCFIERKDGALPENGSAMSAGGGGQGLRSTEWTEHAGVGSGQGLRSTEWTDHAGAVSCK